VVKPSSRPIRSRSDASKGSGIFVYLAEALPIGLMLIGRHFEGATFLQLGYAYERSVDWRRI
jgi:hypothetical protein